MTYKIETVVFYTSYRFFLDFLPEKLPFCEGSQWLLVYYFQVLPLCLINKKLSVNTFWTNVFGMKKEVNVFSENSSILAWLEWSVYLGERCKMFELKVWCLNTKQRLRVWDWTHGMIKKIQVFLRKVKLWVYDLQRIYKMATRKLFEIILL